MPTRVLLADDHRIFRMGLRVLLEKSTEFHIVGEAQDGREARCLAHSLKPGVIVMDVDMPVLNGIEATRCIRSELHDVRILALSDRTEKNYITGMLRAGASGYLFKHQCTLEDLVHGIRHVAEGRTYVDPDTMQKILEEYRAKSNPATAPLQIGGTSLSIEEKEVLQYLVEGASIKEIAMRLEVCAKTIERMRDQIMERLLIYSIAGLTKFAIRHGLTTLE
jgi:DNA-binding NarL/FixJ family response regulator